MTIYDERRESLKGEAFILFPRGRIKCESHDLTLLRVSRLRSTSEVNNATIVTVIHPFDW
jgi:hypothetical protein